MHNPTVERRALLEEALGDNPWVESPVAE